MSNPFLNEIKAIHSKASTDEKENLVKKVATLLDTPITNEENLHKAQDILRVMSEDVETSVRATLASYMRSNPQLPKDVAMALARDIESIALPILEHSAVLDEKELIEIIEKSGSAEKQAAIARRENITENITSSLVIHAKEEMVFTALLQNQTAQISQDSLQTIVKKNGESEAVMKALVERDSVPVEVINRLTADVSDRIRDAMMKHAKEKYGISNTQIDNINEHGHAISVLKILDNRTTLFDARALVVNLIETRRMDAGIFITALLMGKRHFVKYAIALMSGEAFSVVEKLVIDANMPVKFEELLDKAGLLPTFSTDIFHALRYIETREMVGQPSNKAMKALYAYINSHPQLFPNAYYFQMVLQSQPGFYQ